MLTEANSVRRDPLVVNILLKGLALLVDMSSLDASYIDDNFQKLHSCLVKVLISVYPRFLFLPQSCMLGNDFFFLSGELGFHCRP